MEEKAARAYDQAALKYWGPSTHINFPVHFYLLSIFLLALELVLIIMCLRIYHIFCFSFAVRKLPNST
jgi:hypothetical protein